MGFEVLGVGAGGGRRGRLRLPHGVVETPVFMPVGTQATVKAVPQETLEGLGASGAGAQIILANTYHLYLRPGHELVRRMGGVHRFMGWRRPMLTDSGGFQVWSLSKLRKVTAQGVEFRSHLDGGKHFFSPEHSMAVQIALGADVMMVFDECVETPATYERTRESMELTHAWAERSKAYFEEHKAEVPWFGDGGKDGGGLTHHDRAVMNGTRGFVDGGGEHPTLSGGAGKDRAPDSLVRPVPGETQRLFGIVQGGMYADLRRESAERLVAMDLPGYAIGGLAVGEPREVTREMIARTLEWLPKDKPRYVMGVGYPDEIEEYARMGVDMMDCVLPTRAGRHGLVFARMDGQVARMNMKRLEYAEDAGPIDAGCGCVVCGRYSRAYLRHLLVAKEPLAATLLSVHNLAFYLDTMERVRGELAGEAKLHPREQAGVHAAREELSMENERERLNRLYAEMGEERLRELASAPEDLTGDARAALAGEMRRRGLAEPARAGAAGPVSVSATGERGAVVMTEEPEREDVFSVGIPGVVPTGVSAMEQALEPGGEERKGMARLLLFYDGIELTQACRTLEEAGVEFTIEEVAGDGVRGVSPHFEVWVETAEQERARGVLRETMALFPLAEMAVGDGEQGAVEDGVVGVFETRAEAEAVRAMLAGEGFAARVEGLGEELGFGVEVAPGEQGRALAMVARRLGVEEGAG